MPMRIELVYEEFMKFISDKAILYPSLTRGLVGLYLEKWTILSDKQEPIIPWNAFILSNTIPLKPCQENISDSGIELYEKIAMDGKPIWEHQYWIASYDKDSKHFIVTEIKENEISGADPNQDELDGGGV